MSEVEKTTGKHTPGPWTIGGFIILESRLCGPMEFQILCNRETKDLTNGSDIAYLHKDYPNFEANARLIKAAPKLLAALEKICGLYEVREHIGENCADGYEAVDYALSVLSEVKG